MDRNRIIKCPESGTSLLISILDVGIRERNQEAGEVSRDDDYLQRGQSFIISLSRVCVNNIFSCFYLQLCPSVLISVSLEAGEVLEEGN